MDIGKGSPLVELFRRGDVTPDMKRMAAAGEVAAPAPDQLTMLVLLAADGDPAIAQLAAATLDAVPAARLAAVLALPEVSVDVRSYFATRTLPPASPAGAGDLEAPLVGADADELMAIEVEVEPAGPGQVDEAVPRAKPLASLTVAEKLKLAMRGTREQRSVLVRDPNKIVAAAVLSSPKLSESEVESFARMTNVSEEVLRVIGGNRAWIRSYAVACALVKNPKTPIAVSLGLVPRLNERDLKTLSTDRNLPEAVRLAVRKFITANQARRQ